jgi:trimeric autotransporter adhesin
MSLFHCRVENKTGRLPHMKKNSLPLALVSLLIGFACLDPSKAVVPPPDGGYPGFNTAEGQNALMNLTTGTGNTAVGWSSLFTGTIASFNTGVGAGTLALNTADSNTAVGTVALFLNTTGDENVAVGTGALVNNDTGDLNTANGAFALSSNTTGFSNTAIGYRALQLNTTGGQNTAIGFGALGGNATGFSNTAVGTVAGSNITGTGNICIGWGVGGEAGVDDRTYIRNVNTLTQNFSAGVNDYVTVRLSDGRLGHTAVVSSRRYKEDIKPLAAASEALYELKPVSFRLKKEYDETQRRSFGLIAEEVEKIDPGLVYYNDNGQAESVRYELVNAMLLNEFLKEHKAFVEEQHNVEKLEATVANLVATVKEQAAQIQKVSAQLEASKPAPQLVNNP